MENQEDVLLSSIVKKGKRTKRPRTATTHRSTQTSPVDETASASGSGDRDCLTEDDEEMANCLILLSQGPTENSPVQPSYECKTCNKSFNSFQALGGHRASHKKLKLSPPPGTEEQNNTTTADTSLHMSGPVISLPTPSVMGTGIASTSAGTGSKKVNKIHECSICGAEFNSGQALGGHMRRHRPLVVAPPEILVQEVVKKEKTMLELDLNLPAPFEEEESGELVNGGGEAFPFEMENNTGSVGKPQLFTSSLIDCHY